MRRSTYGPRWVLAVGGALVSLAASGCLFMDTVNEVPKVSIQGPDQVLVGQKATFSATVGNKTGGVLFEWGKTSSCPANAAEARGVPEGDRLGMLQTTDWTIQDWFPESAKRDYCVFVIVTDEKRAEGFAIKQVKLTERKLVISGPAQFTSGMPAMYTARFSDDDAAATRAKFHWAMSAAPDGPCDAAKQLAENLLVEKVTPTSSQWEEKASRRPFCVWAIAHDSYDVRHDGQYTVTTIVNGGPPADIRLVTPKQMPVGIFNAVRLAAAADGELNATDDIKFDWTVKRPDGSMLQHAVCPGVLPAGSEICFDVSTPGQYPVSLTATEAGQMRSATKMLEVEDRPPCIRQTRPELPAGSGAATVFNLEGENKPLDVVSVDDDGDPIPATSRASEGVFVWSIKTKDDADFQVLPYAIFRSYILPTGQFRPGDEIEVRVEYRDRLDVTNLNARDLSHCKRNDLACETKPDSGCFVRVGWKVFYL